MKRLTRKQRTAASAIARGTMSLRTARAVFGVTALLGVARNRRAGAFRLAA
jgi:hypothetical protein